MKIVQSLWSKPMLSKDSRRINNDFVCGWLNKKNHCLSWVLSSNQFRKYYDQVELVTDEAGYDLLIKKLQLPYNNVKVILDDLNHYHKELWAIGKLTAYSIQNEPFIHADSDVYIWEKFDQRLESASLLCQNREEGMVYNETYLTVLFHLAQHFDYYPNYLDKAIDEGTGIKSINAGILGGRNMDFFRYYTQKAFEFVQRNMKNLDQVNVDHLNIIFEQVIFRSLVEERGEVVTFFNGAQLIRPSCFTDYTSVPMKNKYLHACGPIKRDRYLGKWLEIQVLKNYPDQYYHLIDLIKSGEI